MTFRRRIVVLTAGAVAAEPGGGHGGVSRSA